VDKKFVTDRWTTKAPPRQASRGGHQCQGRRSAAALGEVFDQRSPANRSWQIAVETARKLGPRTPFLRKQCRRASTVSRWLDRASI
jgi:hypothetical protein